LLYIVTLAGLFPTRSSKADQVVLAPVPSRASVITLDVSFATRRAAEFGLYVSLSDSPCSIAFAVLVHPQLCPVTGFSVNTTAVVL
jgi:hypothetical protein